MAEQLLHVIAGISLSSMQESRESLQPAGFEPSNAILISRSADDAPDRKSAVVEQ